LNLSYILSAACSAELHTDDGKESAEMELKKLGSLYKGPIEDPEKELTAAREKMNLLVSKIKDLTKPKETFILEENTPEKIDSLNKRWGILLKNLRLIWMDEKLHQPFFYFCLSFILILLASVYLFFLIFI
jgi:hypothetical protein